MDLCLIFDAGDLPIPDYRDEVLLLHFKPVILESIGENDINFFGYAPDNTADGDDELLNEGTFFRLIASAGLLNLTLDSPAAEVVAAFKNLVETQPVHWGTVIVEEGFINKETTIEFIF